MQQMLAQLPRASLSDFKKDEAVMIVSTEGTTSGGVTAITLLGGVDAVLRASPQMTLAPWSMGGGGEGGGGGDDN